MTTVKRDSYSTNVDISRIRMNDAALCLIGHSNVIPGQVIQQLLVLEILGSQRDGVNNVTNVVLLLF